MKEFFEDFIKMQAELPAVMKSKQGQAGQGKFKYADLTEIVETIRPVLAKYGFAFMQPILTTEGKTFLRTKLIHKSGASFDWDIEITFQGDDIKKFGAAITYYRRYALQSVLGIVADVDADDLPDTIAKRPATPPVNEEDKLAMFYNQNAQGFNWQDVKNFFNARSGYNKRPISLNIDDFIGKPEAFLRELNSWLSKQQT